MWREEPTYQRRYQPACESDAGVVKGNTGRHLLLKTDRTSHTGSLQTVTTVNTWYMELFHTHVLARFDSEHRPRAVVDLASPLQTAISTWRWRACLVSVIKFLMSFDYDGTKHVSAAWKSWKWTWCDGKINLNAGEKLELQPQRFC